MKQVYILLSRTGSIPSNLIYLFTRKKYTHVSISLEPAEDKFCSYGRRRLHNVLVGGLIRENIHGGLFELFEDCVCELFSIEVEDEAYEKLAQLMKFHFDNYDKCKYKFSAIMAMTLGKEKELKLKLVCSQFVAKLLHDSGACALPKHPSLMHPSDFLSIPNMKSIYVGKIKDCHFPVDIKQ